MIEKCARKSCKYGCRVRRLSIKVLCLDVLASLSSLKNKRTNNNRTEFPSRLASLSKLHRVYKSERLSGFVSGEEQHQQRHDERNREIVRQGFPGRWNRRRDLEDRRRSDRESQTPAAGTVREAWSDTLHDTNHSRGSRF